jgi:alpha-ribazole phosphatase/probable phosphoglycerate mutase
VSNRCWDHIICSPLHRCLDFAQQQTQTSVSIDAQWQEINFGDWEGKTAKQIDADELQRFYQDPVKNTPNNAESFSDFLDRINQAWNGLIKTYSGQHILVITHAGVIRALFFLLLDLPTHKLFNLQIDHASLTRFQCYEDDTQPFHQLQFHNLSKLHY